VPPFASTSQAAWKTCIAPVCVERRDDLGDLAEVAVDELAQSPAVVGRARHEELEARRAERVLAVDEQQPHPPLVFAGRPDVVRVRPAGRLGRACLVGNPPDVLDPMRVPVRR
jgi:hypothetical protein